ncbi:MAG: tRNA preQ1(34) S-adenosylmethionine ribosyltransferase-isomerase QueA [Coriobacteriia bacterium]|nr:tRNA preQ1(34) S-adenosylmethionine ribosyltransferase-isomerase QueA [Coriobacteriia bacterium]
MAYTPFGRPDERHAVLTEDFDYDLPSGLVAQHPAQPRDSCRLLVLDRVSGQVDHRVFADLPELLSEGDLLVVNETRVMPARLKGAKDATGGAVEVLLLRERYEDTWECLVRPGRRLKPGARIVFGDGGLTALVVDQLEGGGRLLHLAYSTPTLMDAVHELGEIPLPPYVTEPLEDPELYQTVFAREERSAAAPTAGLHFTPGLLERLGRGGVRVARIGLDVGIDTFLPVTEENAEDHRIHAERFHLSEAAARETAEAGRRGGRVVAVGTTVVRALESAYDHESGEVVPAEGRTDLFILAGFRFNVVDALVTNFHAPRSTLLMMVSAFAGRENVMGAYRTAMREGYRFLSFGDAMLIL